jgi:nicotinamide riboside transporter PnuC
MKILGMLCVTFSALQMFVSYVVGEILKVTYILVSDVHSMHPDLR